MLDEILNLKNIIIQEYQHIENIGIFSCGKKKKKAICPRCGEISHKIHQNHDFMVKYFPICGQDLYLKLNCRQWKSKKCGKPFSEDLSIVKKKRTYTKRLSVKILEEVKDRDILNVSKRNNVIEEEIQRVIVRCNVRINEAKSIGSKKSRDR